MTNSGCSNQEHEFSLHAGRQSLVLRLVTIAAILFQCSPVSGQVDPVAPAGLASYRKEERLEALDSIARSPTLGDSTLEVVVALCWNDPERTVRVRAICVLCRHDSQEALEILVGHLAHFRDLDVVVGICAGVQSLARLGAEDRLELVEALLDVCPRFRLTLEREVRAQQESDAIQDALMEAATDPDARMEARRNAILVLGVVRSVRPDTIGFLASVANGDDRPSLRMAALDALRRHGVGAVDATPALIELLDDQLVSLRTSSTLARLGVGTASQLVAGYPLRSPLGRARTLETLSILTNTASAEEQASWLSVILLGLWDPAPRVRLEAIELAQEISPRHDLSGYLRLRFLLENDPRVRRGFEAR
jgi:HEAT repeat protein